MREKRRIISRKQQRAIVSAILKVIDDHPKASYEDCVFAITEALELTISTPPDLGSGAEEQFGNLVAMIDAAKKRREELK